MEPQKAGHASWVGTRPDIRKDCAQTQKTWIQIPHLCLSFNTMTFGLSAPTSQR